MTTWIETTKGKLIPASNVDACGYESDGAPVALDKAGNRHQLAHMPAIGETFPNSNPAIVALVVSIDCAGAPNVDRLPIVGWRTRDAVGDEFCGAAVPILPTLDTPDADSLALLDTSSGFCWADYSVSGDEAGVVAYLVDELLADRARKAARASR